jgi:hypothetical protein
MKNKILASLMVSALIPSVSFAGGSVSLLSIIPVVAQSPQLTKQLAKVLKNTGESIDNIDCIGTRLGKHFKAVSGARVSPYVCQFGSDATLTIKASLEFLNLKSESVDPLMVSDEDTLLIIENLTEWKWK